MATLFKKQYTKPLPDGAKVIERKGKCFAQWTDRKGKRRTAEMNDTGDRIRVEAGTWTAKYRDGEGVTREVATGCRDKQAAAAVLKDLTTEAEKVASGILTTTDVQIKKHQQTPLSDHITDYIEDLKERGKNAERIKTSDTYLADDAAACGFRFLRDLDAGKLRKHLNGMKGEDGKPISPAKYNWHSALWTAFGWWLCGKRLEGKRPMMTGETTDCPQSLRRLRQERRRSRPPAEGSGVDAGRAARAAGRCQVTTADRRPDDPYRQASRRNRGQGGAVKMGGFDPARARTGVDLQDCLVDRSA